MKLIHRIFEKATPQMLETLSSFGIVVVPDPLNLIMFEMDESDERWPAIQQWMAAQGFRHSVRTTFSQAEISSAKWLKLNPQWHHGYPQPNEDEFGHLTATYDLGDYCEQCDIGRVQRAAFQMRGEPKWGRRGMLQMNWVFDEFFATPDVWVRIFKPFGVACRPVHNRKGQELRTVVQLVVPELVHVGTHRLEGYRCELCGLIKYRPFTKGFFHALTTRPASPMIKTYESFGSGASAWRATIISQELRTALTEARVRGVEFTPLAESSATGQG
jgi:hypothetical protein